MPISHSVDMLDRAFAMLHFMAARPQSPPTVTEISEAVGVSKGSCHRILKSLQNSHLVVFDYESKRYALGPALIPLGAAAIQHSGYVQLAVPYVRRLVYETKLDGALSEFRDDGHTVTVERVESSRPVRLTVSLGQRFPATLTQCLVAWLADEEVDRLINRAGLPRYNPDRALTISQYKHELAQVRRQGYDKTCGGYHAASPDFCGLNASVFDAQCRPVLAVTLFGFASDFAEADLRRYTGPLLETAHRITAALGGGLPPGFPVGARELETTGELANHSFRVPPD